jgi:integrase
MGQRHVREGQTEMDTPFVERLRPALEADDLAPGTITRTLIDARQFEEWLAGTAGSGIDPDDVQVTAIDLAEFRGWLQRQQMTAGTIQRKFASIRKSLILVAPEVALKVRWPKLPTESRPSPSGFTTNQRRALMRAIDRTDVRSRAILTLLVNTGARGSTIAAAKLSKVRLRERSGEIEFDVSKGGTHHTGRTYTVPLNAEARDALRQWIAVRPPVEHDFLFTSERFPFPPISRGVVWSLWKALAAFLPRDFPLGGPHKARHDLARRLLTGDGGLRPPTPIQDVARILGHAGNDPRVTAGVYGAPSEEDLRQSLDAIIGEESEED